MVSQSYLALLREKHAALDRLVWDEEMRPWPDRTELKRLKLQKLRLKEEIDRLTRIPAVAAE